MMFSRKKTSPGIDFKVALDAVQTPIMMIDREMKITYVNQGSIRLINENMEVFREIWPSFNSNNIIGQCIDQFHKDPGHQRRLLAEPSNLPLKTDMTIKDLSFSLMFTAQLDSMGNYIGTTLEWNDVTEKRNNEKINAEQIAIINALDRSQAVIEFDMSGKIQRANDLFLAVMGYSESEIVGKHHSMFVEPAYRESAEYQDFWRKLNSGQFDSAEYKRFGKNNKEVWIRATYNPVYDLHGNLVKVVKMASDITRETLDHQLTKKVLSEARSVMGSIAAGDLTPRMNADYHGDFSDLSNSVNSCAQKLTSIVDEIKSSTDSLNTGIFEISEGNTNLSRQTDTQAASLEVTSASMEKMTEAVKRNAESAQQAKEKSVSTREYATEGGQVVEKAVEAMDQISQASKKISDIIVVIDEIAFQTNLLALNAAVEAARAGEQGRGFAVVASEVRGLAGRSAEAAKEIKELIEDSVHKVGHGTALVNDSGKKLRQIVDGVREVSEFVNEIAEASKNQAAGIDEVNRSISHIEQSTQENSALVEESAACSTSMSQQSSQLIELVSFFSTSKTAANQNAINDSTFAPVENRKRAANQ